jgi:DNA mismatch endonuclease (patch repair protein)
MVSDAAAAVAAVAIAPRASSARARAVMRGNRRRDTAPELRLRSALHAQGLRFRIDLPVRANGLLARPDVVFSRRRLAVFVDGCFWHGCPEHFVASRSNVAYWRSKIERNRFRDLSTDKALLAAGWSVIRVWAHEDVAVAARRIGDAYNRTPMADGTSVSLGGDTEHTSGA